MKASTQDTTGLDFGWFLESEAQEADLFFEELMNGSSKQRWAELWSPADHSEWLVEGSHDSAENYDERGEVALSDTQVARQRLSPMYQRLRADLNQTEQQAMQAFMQGWTLPDSCPFANNNQLNRKEKALLAGAMLAASGVRGTDCGDWVMRVYQYSQGDPYISRSEWRERWDRRQVPFEHPEHRWESLAWAGVRRSADGTSRIRTAVPPSALSLIEPGCWVMYATGPSSGHSILVTRVIPGTLNTNTGSLQLEALESGWFRRNDQRVNIPPRYRTMTLNCGVVRNGIRTRRLGSIFSIQKPQRKSSYTRWLQQQHQSINSP